MAQNATQTELTRMKRELVDVVPFSSGIVDEGSVKMLVPDSRQEKFEEKIAEIGAEIAESRPKKTTNRGWGQQVVVRPA